MNNPPVVVIGVIGNDIHVVANRMLQICLEAHGFRTVNVGTNAMPEDFVEIALEVNADALLIGSLNGEAPHWCWNMRESLSAVGLGHVLIYLGGNLVTGEMPAAEVEQLFRSRGIDRVYYGTTDFDVMLADLKQDLSRGRAAA